MKNNRHISMWLSVYVSSATTQKHTENEKQMSQFA